MVYWALSTRKNTTSLLLTRLTDWLTWLTAYHGWEEGGHVGCLSGRGEKHHHLNTHIHTQRARDRGRTSARARGKKGNKDKDKDKVSYIRRMCVWMGGSADSRGCVDATRKNRIRIQQEWKEKKKITTTSSPHNHDHTYIPYMLLDVFSSVHPIWGTELWSVVPAAPPWSAGSRGRASAAHPLMPLPPCRSPRSLR